ncbi:DUF6011 domain-containing protein [Gordonia sp. (in: high G+C Gram-positive bacteria)]|uniref:DUF6011 domain-containing protein n=1 Tax=Gordonia sp. (in: high G+C Gram-positive bacteria) TaxID=84139 RepID=UPI00261690AD|nr:DUF6011 domain-containing protein [Gordonia sp. (in: high G+C Gram-positive bacteria)]
MSEMRAKENPGGGTGASPESIAADLFNHNARTEALEADERREVELIAELLDRGYRIAVRCHRCGHWLTNVRSIRVFTGPVCRRREAGDDRE